MTKPTGLVWHELLMWHDTSALAGFLTSGRGVIEPDEPAEGVAGKRRIKNLLDVAGLTEQLTLIKPRPASDEELTRVHAADYIAALKSMSAGSGGDAALGDEVGATPFGPGGFDIAALAAGGRELHDPENEPYMYSRAFEDLDGHGFGPFWMDMAAAEQALAPVNG